MKAVVIRDQGRGVEAWKLVDRPDSAPEPGQVLVRVRAASLNHRDLLIARGHFGGPLKDDLIPLADGAGEVVALGAGVTRWKVGDRVAGSYFQTWQAGPFRADYFQHMLGAGSTDGMLAQLVALPDTGVVRIPSHLSYEEAATLPCAGLAAWNALMEPSPRQRPGAAVLTLGTGGVSIFAVQLALAAGLRVIATSSSADKIERLRELGVTDTINYRETPEWQLEVLRLTRGEGVDQVIEVGGGGTLARSLEAVRSGGTVSLIGHLTGTEGELNPFPILVKAVRLQGVVVGSIRTFEDMSRALEEIASRPVIDEILPLHRANEALARMETASHFGKIVVRVD
jgi:NADPH:quinone reductase-like Zn-dependent oxidoreductase